MPDHSHRHSGWRHLVGALSLLSSLVAMGSWLAALALRPTEGYLTTPVATFHTASTALTTDEIDVTDSEARAGNPSPDLGEYATVRIRAASTDPDQPLFIGVWPKGQVEAYLASSEHESFVRAELDPLRATFAHHAGTSTPAPPGDQNFWVASSAGTGTQTIAWDKGPGAWTLVVMHPEGLQGVGATLDAGLRFGQLVPVAVGATVLGASLAAVWAWGRPMLKGRAVRPGGRLGVPGP